MIALVSAVRLTIGLVCSIMFVVLALTPAAMAVPISHLTSASGLEATGGIPVRYRRSASRDDDNAAALFDEGQYEFDSKDYSAARRIFEHLVEEYPRSGFALKAQRYLASIYRRLGDPTRRSRRNVEAAPEKRSLPPKEVRHSPRPKQSEPEQSETVAHAPIAPRTIQPDAPMQRSLLLDVGDRVFFAANSNDIGAKARAVLRRQADWLNKNKQLLVRIEGHSHDQGQQDDNFILSLQRAQRVRRRLVEEGVSADRITVFGRGRSAPVAICDTSMCAAQNRRAMTIVYRVDPSAADRRRAALPNPQR